MNSPWRKRLLSRRNFLALGATGIGGLAYMRFAETEWLEVNQPIAKLNNASTAREIRVLHLSDFHASDSVRLEFINEAIKLGASLKPDLVCLTGDFITTKYDHFPEFTDILRKLSAAAPAFACLGNHDGGNWARRRGRGYADWAMVGAMLKNAGIQLLHNRSTTLQLAGSPLQLVGLGDIWAQEMDSKKAFAETTKNQKLKTILLSHNPDTKDALLDFSWDLMLSGHTHGGQCKLPLLGTPFAPVLDTRYVAGLKAWKDRLIHVTKGVGNLHGLRFNCRPEVSLLRVIV